MTSLNEDSTLWTAKSNDVLSDAYAAICCINISINSV